MTHSMLASSSVLCLEILKPVILTLRSPRMERFGRSLSKRKTANILSHELTAGTPFTQDGAKELLRLGILTICIPLGCLILAEIVSGILAGFLNCDDLLKLENGGSVALGVMFIFMSLLCEYGAECNDLH